ncbi:MAG: T9SS type A sorting domain-containing protein [Flavisolibacter sp.]
MKRSVLNHAFSTFLFFLFSITSYSVIAQEEYTKPVTSGQSSSFAPFKMLSFDAYLNNSNVILNWTKVQEENTFIYVVERSIDGKNFKQIALVLGDEKNTISSFSFKDPNVASGTGAVFYRLKFVDEVKRIYYSEIRLIRLVRNTGTVQLTSFPNPVTNELRVTFPNNWQNKKILIEIYSEYGTRLKAQEINNASQTESIQVAELSRGVYIVKASCNSLTIGQRIIKN